MEGRSRLKSCSSVYSKMFWNVFLNESFRCTAGMSPCERVCTSKCEHTYTHTHPHHHFSMSPLISPCQRAQAAEGWLMAVISPLAVPVAVVGIVHEPAIPTTGVTGHQEMTFPPTYLFSCTWQLPQTGMKAVVVDLLSLCPLGATKALESLFQDAGTHEMQWNSWSLPTPQILFYASS